MSLDFAECDRARLARDAAYDGLFYTGVHTTGIYCRPVCPVRPARSANVSLFPSAAAAETAASALMTAADALELPESGDAIFLGLFTGQRQADVLHLVPEVQTPDRQRFKQSRTGAIVSIPPTPQLAARLAAAAERRRLEHNQIVDTTIVIHGATGMRFVSSTFRHRFAEVRDAAVTTCPSVATLRYQDLRDTAVTWYARSGCTVPEIAAITGHSLRSVYSILRHYLSLDEHLADAAVAKLVAWMEPEGIAV
jgi:integrase